MAEQGPRPATPIRRFYKEAASAPIDTGHSILIDGRPVLTPQRARLVVPSPALAADIVAEWARQGEHILPATMPLTRIANTAIDRVGGERDAIAGEIAGYAGADLLCYRAETPAELASAQGAAWDALIAWAERLAGCRLVLAGGLVHVAQDPRFAEAVRTAALGHDDFALAALSMATSLTGSAILALALAQGRVAPDAAWKSAHVDEDHQVARWGEDGEASARRALMERDFLAAARVLDLSRAYPAHS